MQRHPGVSSCLGKMGWSGLFDGKMEIREVRFFRSLAPITGVLCVVFFGVFVYLEIQVEWVHIRSYY